MFDAQYWIQKLNLQPHPEGGFFAETYRSNESIKGMHLPQRYTGDRSFSTALYFLIAVGNFSALHRIQSDELWHFYTGSTLTVHVIHPEGRAEVISLGPDIENGEVFQAVVKAGCWFGSSVNNGSGYALVGCTVAPGFDFADFELANRADLIKLFPDNRSIIEQLTR
jgi:predicted cupin superfamily sugar epimerase